MSLIGRFLSAHEFRTEAFRVSSIVVWTGSLVVFLFYFLAFLQIQNSFPLYIATILPYSPLYPT